jgi:predicted TIM-barrel fold metal-dependent hydrolase
MPDRNGGVTVGSSIEFLDCNARIGRPMTWRVGQITTVPELLAEMDYGGIAQALVHHTLASQWSPREGNAALLGEIEGQERLLPCFVALPSGTGEMAPPAEFAREVRDRHGAVRLFPRDHSYAMATWSTGELFEALSAQGVPVLIDIGQTDWAELARLLEDHPALNVVLLDMYYRVDRYLYPLLERHPNLHVETTTYQVHLGIEAACERFGHGRLVFGTNLPHLEVGGPVAQVMYADLPDEAKAAIAGGNLRRLLGLA